MMEFLIILIIILLFLFEINNKQKYKKGSIYKPCTKERFLGSYETLFDDNSKNNDYYFDRSGRKGVLFRPLKKKKWELPKLVKREPNYPKAIHKLELYPEKFYTKCVSEFDNDALQKIQPTPHNDPYNTFLQFNKGVLIPIRCDSKSINSGTKHE